MSFDRVGGKGLNFCEGQSTQSSHKFRARAHGSIEDVTTPGQHSVLVRSIVLDRS
jgi:hypothetical protein